MSNARNIARLLPNASGQLPNANLVGGKVVQVVSSATTTGVNTTSGTRIDTTLSAAITPTSATSKILVIVLHADNQIGGTSTGMGLWLMRNALDLAQIEPFMGYSASNPFYPGGTGITYLDAPATTSSVTYKTQFCVSTGVGNTVRVQGNGGRSSITLMEIAA